MLDKNHIENSIKNLGSGHAIIWFHSEIVLHNIPEDNQKIIDSIESLNTVKQIRLFNESREIKYWRSLGELKSREKIDDSSKSELCHDVPMVLRSIIADKLKRPAKGELSTIITRQYIDYNEIGQAGYVDYRFVKFGSL